MTRRCGEFIWEKAFRWCEGENFHLSFPSEIGIQHFPALRKSGATGLQGEQGTSSSYQGVGTLSFRVLTIYLGA